MGREFENFVVRFPVTDIGAGTLTSAPKVTTEPF